MKSIVLFITMLVVCVAFAIAQETYTMTTYYPAPNGYYDQLSANNVGVGTSTPTTRIGLYETNSAANPVQISIKNNGTGITAADGALIGYGSGANNTRLLIVNQENGPMNFWTNNTNRVTILAGGNVGMGSSDPAAQLDVLANGTGHIMIGDMTYANYAGISLNGSAAAGFYNFLGMNGQPLYINRPAGQDIRFRENNADQIAMRTGGNLGIGSSVPAARLDVMGNGTGHIMMGDMSYGNWAGISFNGSAAGGNYNLLGANGQPFLINRPTGQDIQFRENNATQVTIRNASGAVGIGTSVPSYPLFVNGTIASRDIAGNGTVARMQGLNSGMWLSTEATAVTDSIFFAPAATTRMTILESGRVAIGPNPPTGAYDLDVDDGTGVALTLMRVNGEIWAYDFPSLSDARSKENIVPISKGLEKVKALNGVYFNYIGKNKKQVGLIAQDVQKVVPEAVFTAADGMLSMDYSKIVAVLIEAIKEQQVQIDAMEKRLKDLESIRR
jgi:hypothetical protein